MPSSPSSNLLESPIQVFIDDNDLTTASSREPSPIRYARRGSNSSDEFVSLSRSRSPTKHLLRPQLRSYSNAYWAPLEPQDDEYSLSRSPSPMHYARRLSIDEEVKVMQRTQPRSYQFEFGPSSANGKVNSARHSSPDINKSRIVKGLGLMTNIIIGGGDEVRKSRSQSPRKKWKGGSQPALAPLRRPVDSAHVLDISLAARADGSKTSMDSTEMSTLDGSVESQSGPDSSSASINPGGLERNQGSGTMSGTLSASPQLSHPFYPHRRVLSSNAILATQLGSDIVESPQRTSERVRRGPAEAFMVHHDALRPQGRRESSVPPRFTDFAFMGERIPSPSSLKRMA